MRERSNLPGPGPVIGIPAALSFFAVTKLTPLLLALLGLGSCQRSGVRPRAAADYLARGQVMRYDVTYDAQGRNPRVRWVVQLASPLRVPGWGDRDYTQVKVFSLADTTTFRPGVKFRFTYQLVPQATQTAWATTYEQSAAQDFPAGYLPNPELVLHDVVLQ